MKLGKEELPVPGFKPVYGGLLSGVVSAVMWNPYDRGKPVQGGGEGKSSLVLFFIFSFFFFLVF